eukprot:3264706-Alexandrium_andersonii.AAC.1
MCRNTGPTGLVRARSVAPGCGMRVVVIRGSLLASRSCPLTGPPLEVVSRFHSGGHLCTRTSAKSCQLG